MYLIFFLAKILKRNSQQIIAKLSVFFPQKQNVSNYLTFNVLFRFTFSAQNTIYFCFKYTNDLLSLILLLLLVFVLTLTLTLSHWIVVRMLHSHKNSMCQEDKICEQQSLTMFNGKLNWLEWRCTMLSCVYGCLSSIINMEWLLHG